MAVVDDQFESLRSRYRFGIPTLTRNGDGSYVVVVPDYPLPPGWNKDRTTVYFVVPVGYPVARPDCFWTDPGLTLASGAPPQNTGVNHGPGLPPHLLWFSWHPQSWAPNHDSLQSYVGVIHKRFQEVR